MVIHKRLFTIFITLFVISSIEAHKIVIRTIDLPGLQNVFVYKEEPSIFFSQGINLSGNDLSEHRPSLCGQHTISKIIDNIAAQCPLVTQLILSNCNLGHHDCLSNISKLKHLVYLDISGNRLRSIPSEIYSLKDLEYLDCSNNLISCLPQSLSRLTTLRRLNLSNNPLVTYLPKTVKTPGLFGNQDQIEALSNCLPITPYPLCSLQFPNWFSSLIANIKCPRPFKQNRTHKD